MALQKRVSGTLEVESGINDPTAIFLTMICVELLRPGHQPETLHLAGLFLAHTLGGLLVGLAGGFVMAGLFNRVTVAGGLDPIGARAAALVVCSGAYCGHARAVVGTTV